MSIFDKFADIRNTLAELSANGQNPLEVRFDEINSPVEGMVGGKRVLLFGTSNYLGLTFDADCIEAGVHMLRESGTGTTGSRIANGTYTGHASLESQLANFYGKRTAMVFSTGYQANLGLISALAGREDHLFIDADSHASIYDACRLSSAEVIRFRHNDADDLARRIARLKDKPGCRIIVTEGIYSMLGDTAPLREIAAVKRETGSYLIVDEAHSMGVLGARGRGLCEAAGVEADVDFVVGTFSKSLGAMGGFAVSDLEGFDLLRVAARPYMFTASLPPSIVATVSAALHRIQKDPSLGGRVRANGLRLYRGLQKAGFLLGPQPNPVVAVKMPDRECAVTFWKYLLSEGVYLNLALPPATPGSLALLRSSVNAQHTDEQIDCAIAAITRVGVRLGLIKPAAPGLRVNHPEKLPLPAE
ncbi:MAG TPA: aminotransferase class I/II-fold pyridoxal phosphate-dependent enzyme [Alphaproteobacteria bacterium]|nr:aminotransferase class I/II-fold pyridoxal phosphate-dependent enzyme [Alphaproteobacteria bacterium]